MGIGREAIVFLLQARQQGGVDFTRTLTLGHQEVPVNPKRVEELLRQFGAWPPCQGVEQFRSMMAYETRFEALAMAIGSSAVESCDFSAYEGATFIHDLSLPVPQERHGQYDVVIDGGTLEHVFNFPVAIQNCMKLLKTGGTLFLFSPINNYCGHGFYQFSPELFYRLLCSANGFEVTRMTALEDASFESRFLGQPYVYDVTGRCYAVPDPASVRARVLLINTNPTIIMVSARKTRDFAVLQQAPLQSDYVVQWDSATQSPDVSGRKRSALATWLLSTFGEDFCWDALPRIVGWLDPFRSVRYKRQHSFKNRKVYRPE